MGSNDNCFFLIPCPDKVIFVGMYDFTHRVPVASTLLLTCSQLVHSFFLYQRCQLFWICSLIFKPSSPEVQITRYISAYFTMFTVFRSQWIFIPSDHKATLAVRLVALKLEELEWKARTLTITPIQILMSTWQNYEKSHRFSWGRHIRRLEK